MTTIIHILTCLSFSSVYPSSHWDSINQYGTWRYARPALTPLSLPTARSNQLFPCSSISVHSPLLAINANPTGALKFGRGVYTRANQD